MISSTPQMTTTMVMGATRALRPKRMVGLVQGVAEAGVGGPALTKKVHREREWFEWMLV
jgi:hypothetical protein